MAEHGTTTKDLESWKNDTHGVVALRRLDHRGELNKVEIVEGGRTLHISPLERRLNSENAANADQDFFRNGILTPVRLLEDSDEARELASNPNVMSEADMRALFKAQWKTFDARVAAIRNPGTLERLLAMAHEEDATIKKVETIRARMIEVAPSLFAETNVVPTGPGASATGSAPARAVTPR